MATSLRVRVGRAVFLAVVAAVYGFLLLPLVIVILASFNAGELLTFPPKGFSLRWYGHFFNSQPFMDSLFFSLRLAAMAMVLATLLGTTAALYVVRFAGPWSHALRLLIFAPSLPPA